MLDFSVVQQIRVTAIDVSFTRVEGFQYHRQVKF